MRLATITNWAYGATVLFTLASGATMLLASDAQEKERAAVAQRYRLDQGTSQLGAEIYALSGLARQYTISADPTHLELYKREATRFRQVEDRFEHLDDAGASLDELNAVKEAFRWAQTLHDEQRSAIAARQEGDQARALAIVFGAEYERELDRAEGMIERFQYRLDTRIEAEVTAAARLAQVWKTMSEIMLGLTGFLFLCVLYFVFKRRVLHPVIRLSDVVARLAAQDYAAEPPDYEQIDEIGDMAQALRVFRENGIERQRLEEEQDADRAMRDLLSRMTQRMQGCDTKHDLEGVVQRFFPEIVPAWAGTLYLLDTGRNALVAACSWGSPAHSQPEFSPLACWGLRRTVLHRPAGDCLDVVCDHLQLDDVSRPDTICLPLTAQRETLGLLYLERRAGENAGPADPEPYLTMIAENVALALANLQLRDTLRDMAMADTLTGLSNRRHLDTLLDVQVREAASQGQAISCLMLDIDHFKSFNDKFGHDAGDAVLREVGLALKRSIRDGALAFRYGGEEFMVLLPALEAEPASQRAEEIRTRIGELHVQHEGIDLGRITASIGLATVPEHCSPDRLVQTADAALLRAKKAGRNRVVVADSRRRDHVAAA